MTSAMALPPVRVRTLAGGELAVGLPEGARSQQLKSHLSKELGMPTGEMKLVLGNKVLGPGAALEPGQAVTLVRTSRLPAFLERKGLASVNAAARDGSTALHLAVAQGDLELCLELLADCDFSGVNSVDFLGSSALHRAAERGLPEVCRAILERGDFALDAAADRSGRTALHFAALRGDEETCRALLARPGQAGAGPGALARARDVLGQTAAEMAEGAGHEVLAEMLSSAAASDGERA